MLRSEETEKRYLFDPETRYEMGTCEGTPADIPGSFIWPNNSCEDAPPEDIPEGKTAWRNLENTAWLIVDLPTPADMRRAAYEAEADMIREEARKYEDEAAVQRRLGNAEAAAVADTHERELLESWIAKKKDIRVLYPDEPEAEAEPEVTEEGDE